MCGQCVNSLVSVGTFLAPAPAASRHIVSPPWPPLPLPLSLIVPDSCFFHTHLPACVLPRQLTKTAPVPPMQRVMTEKHAVVAAARAGCSPIDRRP